MKYLGIDYGEKRIGLALSDERAAIAFPHSTISNNEDVLDIISSFIEDNRIGAIVIGDTRSSSDLPNLITKEVEMFAERLKKETGKSVVFQRELGTSIEASRYAPEDKTHDDAAAAAVILQRYFDMQGKKLS